MTSQAIIKRKKYLLKHLNVPARLCSSFSRFGLERYGHETDTRPLHQVSEQSHSEAEISGRRWNVLLTAKEELLSFSRCRFAPCPPGGISVSAFSYDRRELAFPFSVRGLSQGIHTASTATAGQPEMHGEKEPNEDLTQKQIKEASPEECDQAVEGLSTVKAKAKAKQMQDSSKTAQSLIYKFWAKLLGIGPALKAVASMSRF